jgi:hypothetical protein
MPTMTTYRFSWREYNHPMELTWNEYRRHVHNVVTPESIAARAADIRSGGKFAYAEGGWSPISYPGTAIVSMMNEDSDDDGLVGALRPIRDALGGATEAPDAIYCLSEASYHQTLANTFSDERYRNYVVEPGHAETFPQRIAHAFDAMPATVKGSPVELRLIGISIFQTCIALVADVPNASDYERILAFRDGVYGFESLKEIGLERTRPFLGHVTLAYFGRGFTDEESRALVETVNALNESIALQPITFAITSTALRWYDDLSAFQTRPGFPSFSFLGD